MSATQVLWRLTWKEYRVQRNLWWAILIMTVLLDALIACTLAIMDRPPLTAAGHVVIVFGAVAVYLLGCGATLFSLEHEQGTFEFQRLLPTTAGQVYLAKMGLAMASGLALWGCLSLFALFLAALMPTTGQLAVRPSDWGAGVVTFLEIFLWAVFFSLLIREPLKAAVCGIFASSIVVCAVFPLLSPETWTEDMLTFHRQSVFPRALFAFGLLVVDTGLAWRWFDRGVGAPAWWRALFSRGSGADQYMQPVGAVPRYQGARRLGWGRLVGITWRQGKWVWLACCSLLTLTGMAALLTSSNNVADLADFYLPISVLTTILFSICSFAFDQRSSQFRFYAERGIDARWLWLSRHVVWLAPILLHAILGQLAMSQEVTRMSSTSDRFLARFGWLLFCVMTYAVGQMWAMFLRSTLLSLVTTVFSAILAFWWMMIMVQGLVPIWWSVLPLPIVCLFATWYFAPNWIEERREKDHWRRVVLVFGLPAAIVLPAVACHRAFSLPDTPAPVLVAEYTRAMSANERETLDLYSRAYQSLPDEYRRSGRVAYDEAHRESYRAQCVESIGLLRQAHERPPVPLTLVPLRPGVVDGRHLGSFDATPLVELVRQEALHLTEQGKLAEAWRLYVLDFELLDRFRLRAGPGLLMRADGLEAALLASLTRWAQHPQQSTDSLQAALSRLAELDRATDLTSESVRNLIKIDYVLWSMLVDGDDEAPAQLGVAVGEATLMRGLLFLMPWEAERCRRLSNLTTAYALERRHESGQFPKINELRQSTLPLVANRYPLVGSGVDLWTRVLETDRRGARISVAISAWRKDHQGAVPDRLEELVGSYLTEAPVYPGTTRPFFYSKVGRPNAVRFQDVIVLPAATPFLWAPGHSRVWLDENPIGNFQVVLPIGEPRRPYLPSVDEAIPQGLVWMFPPVTKSGEM